ncbi:HNH endonuclease [Variovorax sp. J22P271]|uniref:HNH endonuclease n=1 Tax=Variovorax davisae TaxID=3053515 RepID=UPI00257833C8|nr:HNH endonuclease [Variovorax sp. J22P271]MDM0032093.1 HNH endonuclease [Variovorax sp. J22P271]
MKRRHWTEAELAELRRLYPDMRAQDVADRLGRRVGSVHQKAVELGIRKSDAFKASDLSGRVTRGHQHPNMIASRFQKGQASWTKGTKGILGVQEGCRATQFKKGAMAGAAQHNYVPVGSLRTSKDGYLERKVTDDPALYPARRWVPVARLVWEAAHGPIPRGHIVIYRPGMKTLVEPEITADRLECISKAENARRNHPRSKSPDLARLVQLKGAITRQVNRIAREAQEQAP